MESVVDELAEKLGVDPLGFRLRNATKQGDRLPSGLPLPRVGHIEVEEAMKAHPHYNAPMEGAHRGRGVAVGYWTNGGNMSSATINVKRRRHNKSYHRIGWTSAAPAPQWQCKPPKCWVSLPRK